MADYLSPTIDPQVVSLLQDIGQLSDGITGDVVTTKMGRDSRLDRRNQGQIKQSSLRHLFRRRLCDLWRNLFVD